MLEKVQCPQLLMIAGNDDDPLLKESEKIMPDSKEERR